MKRKFRVGNLYINRKCTGALVGVLSDRNLVRLPAEQIREAGLASGHAPRSGWTRYSTQCL